MQISKSLRDIMRDLSKNVHHPVIAENVKKEELQALEKHGFNISAKENSVFPASLTADEILNVAEKIHSGKLRHSRPMPRKALIRTP